MGVLQDHTIWRQSAMVVCLIPGIWGNWRFFPVSEWSTGPAPRSPPPFVSSNWEKCQSPKAFNLFLVSLVNFFGNEVVPPMAQTCHIGPSEVCSHTSLLAPWFFLYFIYPIPIPHPGKLSPWGSCPGLWEDFRGSCSTEGVTVRSCQGVLLGRSCPCFSL